MIADLKPKSNVSDNGAGGSLQRSAQILECWPSLVVINAMSVVANVDLNEPAQAIVSEPDLDFCCVRVEPIPDELSDRVDWLANGCQSFQVIRLYLDTHLMHPHQPCLPRNLRALLRLRDYRVRIVATAVDRYEDRGRVKCQKRTMPARR